MDLALPILWLCGAPCAGKSVTAWSLFQRYQAEQVGYVDIDQVRMLFPPPTDPSERDAQASALGAAGLAAVARAHKRHGSRALIVSGVVDEAEVAAYRRALRGTADITWCALQADERALRERASARGWPEDLADLVVRESRVLAGARFVSALIDTAGWSIGAVADQAQELLRLRPAQTGQSTQDNGGLESHALCLFGPRASGKSTIAWALMLRQTQQGRRVGFVDAEQVGFVHGRRELRDSITHDVIVALASVFASTGADRTIVNGSLSVQLLRRLEGESVDLVQLEASPEAVAHRIAERVNGGSVRLAGDDLFGATTAVQTQMVRLAERQALAYREAPLDATVLDVSSRTAEEAAALIEW